MTESTHGPGSINARSHRTDHHMIGISGGDRQQGLELRRAVHREMAGQPGLEHRKIQSRRFAGQVIQVGMGGEVCGKTTAGAGRQAAGLAGHPDFEALHTRRGTEPFHPQSCIGERQHGLERFQHRRGQGGRVDQWSTLRDERPRITVGVEGLQEIFHGGAGGQLVGVLPGGGRREQLALGDQRGHAVIHPAVNAVFRGIGGSAEGAADIRGISSQGIHRLMTPAMKRTIGGQAVQPGIPRCEDKFSRLRHRTASPGHPW